MTLEERIANAREHYMSNFRDWIVQRKKAFPKGVAEVMFLMPGPAGRPERYRLMRVDLVEAKDPNKPALVEMNVDSDARFQAEPHGWKGSLHAVLYPFVWNGCEFRFVAPSLSWPAVDDWWDEWFDEQERKPLSPDGLGGVIHSMTEPQRTAEGSTFSVDFGSARVDAFHALLDALAATGIREVIVGSFHLKAGGD